MVKRNKFNAVKVKVNGNTCDSKLEAGHYNTLLILERAGNIKDLIFHPRFPIVINDIKVCDVVLDFQFYDNTFNKTRYIDSKGVYTNESKRWHKLLAAMYSIEIEIWRTAGA